MWTYTPFVVGEEEKELVINVPDNIEKLEKLTKEYRLAFDPNVVRILLPYDWPTLLVDIEGDCSPPAPGQRRL